MYNPRYVITNDLLESINAVVAAKSIIENAPLLPLYERQFKNQAIARKVHFSTAIEGNYLRLPEVQNLLNSNAASDTKGYLEKIEVNNEPFVARRRDILEVVNYRDVVVFIEQLSTSEQLFTLTEGLIKNIHIKLLKNIEDEICGIYRDKNALTINYLTGEKLYPYESPQNIENKLQALIYWYNQSATKINPIIKAGLLHLELVRIHPFAEGNGRLARALVTLSLSMDGYDVNHFFCLDEYYDNDAKEYYDHLGKGFNDPIIWLEYFATGMAIEFNRVKDRVLKLSKDSKIKEHVDQRFVTTRQEKILEWINERGYFCNQDYELLFPNVSEDTVLRELKSLIADGIISKKGKTKSARYEYV